MESIQQEGEQLKAQLEKQVQENIQLVKYVYVSGGLGRVGGGGGGGGG